MGHVYDEILVDRAAAALVLGFRPLGALVIAADLAACFELWSPQVEAWNLVPLQAALRGHMTLSSLLTVPGFV